MDGKDTLESVPVATLETETRAGIEAKDKRLNKYGQARSRAKLNQKVLAERIEELQKQKKRFNKHEQAYKKLDECANWLRFRYYYTIDELRLHDVSLCKNFLLCPVCALRRAAKFYAIYKEKFEEILSQNEGIKASFYTITIKNRESLIDAFDHIQKGYRKVGYISREARKGKYKNSEFAKFEGTVSTYEVKRGRFGKKWHPHIHGIVLHNDDFKIQRDENLNPVYHRHSGTGEMLPNYELANEWYGITGDSYIFDLQPITDLSKAMLEIFSYALKFSTMTPEDTIFAWEKLSGKRFVNTTGVFRGVKIPEKLVDEADETLPYIELFYNYIFKKQAYELIPAKSGEVDKQDRDLRLKDFKDQQRIKFYRRLGLISKPAT